jgi:hypothetical protein
MNQKNFLNKIKKIENKININKLRYANFNYWPFVRLKILNKYNKVTNVKKGPKRSILFLLLMFINSSIKYIKQPLKKEAVDVLFFTRSSENQDIIDGKLFNKYSDSFIHYYSSFYNIKVIENYDFKMLPNIERFNKKITHIFFLIVLLKIKFFIKKFFIKKKISFVQLNNEIYKNFNFRIDIENELFWIDYLANFYEKILKQYKPKIVFLVCFYRTDGMALSLACSRLKINLVDYQHGSQNDFHPMYSNWNSVPKEGYEIIPDYFWMWGNIFANKIKIWSSMVNKHNTFVGGNLWFSFIKSNYFPYVMSQNKTNLFFNDNKKITILFTLQGDDYFPDFLLNFLNTYKNKYNFIFRDHPRLPLSDKLKDNLKLISKSSFDEISNLDLYMLLKNIDIHMTAFSTVAFEAQSLNKPTIFYHNNAINGFSNLIGRNGFYFADNNIDFENTIKKILKIKGNNLQYIKNNFVKKNLSSLSR